MLLFFWRALFCPVLNYGSVLVPAFALGGFPRTGILFSLVAVVSVEGSLICFKALHHLSVRNLLFPLTSFI